MTGAGPDTAFPNNGHEDPAHTRWLLRDIPRRLALWVGIGHDALIQRRRGAVTAVTPIAAVVVIATPGRGLPWSGEI